MDTIIVIRDTVAVKFNEMTNLFQPDVNTAETTGWFDLGIVLLVCLSVLVIAIYGIRKYYEDKASERLILLNNSATTTPSITEKPEISQKSPEEKAAEADIKRQSRVYDLMRDICELTRDPGVSKDVKGKYNNTEARSLFELYKGIDSYSKNGVVTPEPSNVDYEEQQT